MNAPATAAPTPDRTKFLGGSDAAAILGLSPWSTPLDIYLEKTGQKAVAPVDPKRERLFRRGKRMEPVVIDMLIEEYGIKVVRRSTPENPNRYADQEFPFLAAEIDYEWEVTADVAARFNLPEDLVGTIQNGEVKTVHPFAVQDRFGEEETDEIPVEYGAQAMHGLMVRGARVTLVAVLIGADNLLVYWIWRDDAVITGMRAKEVAFWNDHVLARVAPDPVNLDDVLQLFSRTRETLIEADEATLLLYDEYCRAKDQARMADESIEHLKFQIGTYMLGAKAIEQDPRGKVKPTSESRPGKHVLALGGNPLLTVSYQSQNRIDTERLRKTYPEVAGECSKTSTFFKFDLPRKKS